MTTRRSRTGSGSAAPRKRFEEHSIRWQRAQLRKDPPVDPKRWNAWLKLSAATRKATNAEKYAQGVNVKDQKRQALLDAAFANMKAKHAPREEWRIRRGIRKMSNDQLRWTAKASKSALDKRARMKVGPGEINMWWY